MNPQEAILSVQDVGVRFVRTDGTPAEALRSVSFKVFPGEFVCILGRSGHGKTTLLNVVAGLLSVHRGEVRVMDRPVTGPGADRGVIFQQDAVFPWMRVEENVAFGLRVRRFRQAGTIADCPRTLGVGRPHPGGSSLAAGTIGRYACTRRYCRGLCQRSSDSIGRRAIWLPRLCYPATAASRAA